MTVAAALLVVVGPTAVGKTAFAVELAEALNGEIVSADSRYIYRGLEVGTAKPSAAERARVAHHLIDVTTPGQSWSLADYRNAATAAITDCHARGVLPMLVGGSGQYVRCIIEGWTIPPQPDTPVLREALDHELERVGFEQLHAWLTTLDPQAAADIHPHNTRRVIRAIEVIFSSGQRFSALRQKRPPNYRITQLGLNRPRAELYARIDARVDAMIAAGLEDECRQLAAQGYGWALPAMASLGYKQMGGYLRGEYDLDEAIRLIKRETRRFVRQQGAWFNRNDQSIRWLHPGAADIALLVDGLREWVAG